MGQYYVICNLTKKECLAPHDYDSGLKLGEIAFNVGPASALVILCESRWAGDEIQVIGDYNPNEIYQVARDQEDGWVRLTPSNCSELERVTSFITSSPVQVRREALPLEVILAFHKCKDDVPRQLRHALEDEIAKPSEMQYPRLKDVIEQIRARADKQDYLLRVDRHALCDEIEHALGIQD